MKKKKLKKKLKRARAEDERLELYILELHRKNEKLRERLFESIDRENTLGNAFAKQSDILHKLQREYQKSTAASD